MVALRGEDGEAATPQKVVGEERETAVCVNGLHRHECAKAKKLGIGHLAGTASKSRYSFPEGRVVQNLGIPSKELLRERQVVQEVRQEPRGDQHCSPGGQAGKVHHEL